MITRKEKRKVETDLDDLRNRTLDICKREIAKICDRYNWTFKRMYLVTIEDAKGNDVTSKQIDKIIDWYEDSGLGLFDEGIEYKNKTWTRR